MSTPNLSNQERSSISSTIIQRNKDLLATWAQPGSFDAWMALYADENNPAWSGGSPSMLIVNNQHFNTRAEIEETFRDLLADRATNVTMQSESVSVLSPQHALHIGDFTFSHTQGGESTDEQSASATTLWTLDGSDWKILHYHQSWPVDYDTEE